MPKTLDYVGYEIEGSSDLFSDSIYSGHYKITDTTNGKIVRHAEGVVYRSSAIAACNGAIVSALLYIDHVLSITPI